MTIISKTEWVRRYAAHVLCRRGWSQSKAERMAGFAVEAEEFEAHYHTPEEAADADMLCWTADEGVTS